MTPLFLAIDLKNIEIVRALLEKGANVNIVDNVRVHDSPP